MLIDSERKLTTPEGLPGRAWYKHQIYAPASTPATKPKHSGRPRGYGTKAMETGGSGHRQRCVGPSTRGRSRIFRRRKLAAAK